MRDFKAGKIETIVATDIISRGIDVDDIELVVNFDVPHDPEDYVHRIGRTARGTNLKGAAITIVSSKDKRRFLEIEKFLGYKVKINELPEGIRPPDDSAPSNNQKRSNNRRKPHKKKPAEAGAKTTSAPNKDKENKPRRRPNRRNKNRNNNPNKPKDKTNV